MNVGRRACVEELGSSGVTLPRRVRSNQGLAHVLRSWVDVFGWCFCLSVRRMGLPCSALPGCLFIRCEYILESCWLLKLRHRSAFLFIRREHL